MVDEPRGLTLTVANAAAVVLDTDGRRIRLPGRAGTPIAGQSLNPEALAKLR
jgi:hypothetical protein